MFQSGGVFSVLHYPRLQYSLHQKKVYTCGKAKYSKSRGLEEKLAYFGPTQWWVWHTPNFLSGQPQFWVLGYEYFLLAETVL